jgi:hypothetical protein
VSGTVICTVLSVDASHVTQRRKEFASTGRATQCQDEWSTIRLNSEFEPQEPAAVALGLDRDGDCKQGLPRRAKV